MNEKGEKRRYPRFPTEKVEGSFSYSVRASVDNLSLGGFAVRTSAQLQVGRKYNFRLGDGPDVVNLEGKVKWCRLAGTEKLDSGDVVPVYSAGIAFGDILTNTAEQLYQFMEKNVILDLKQRIFGRLKVDTAREVDLKTESKFLVKQLSASGMLIITELPPKPESIVKLELQLNEHVFECMGRVVYAAEFDLEEGEFHYRVGIEFVQPSKEQFQILENFIRNELEREG
ncbi:MAG: PilZ domain-containing protein [Thermoanaerobaculia bacterium]